MEELQNENSQTQQHQEADPLEPSSSHDDFLEQMLSHLPNSPWPRDDGSDDHPVSFPSLDDLTSKLRHHNSNSSSMAALLQQQLLLSRGAGDSLLNHLPLGAGALDSRLLHMQGADASVQALFNGGFPAPPLHGNGQTTTTTTTTTSSQPPPFQAGGMGQAPGSTSTPPQRQRVRARRGQATDPHSIAERLRRERIAERMKALQELVPNGNKTDKASMLDEIIDYVKFLQLQVKVLSMSRLGGASAAAAPRVAHLSSEGGRSSNNGNPGGAGSSNDGGMSITESQVVKLMEEDMGSAMQYLQGKGLCLMPISLATAISTATSNTRSNNSHRTQHHPPLHPSNFPPLIGNGNGNAGGGDGPSSPNLSGLTVQSANLVNGDGSIKDPNPPSMP